MWLLPLWLGVDDGQYIQDMLMLGAFGAYSVYRAFNAARQVGGFPAHDGIS